MVTVFFGRVLAMQVERVLVARPVVDHTLSVRIDMGGVFEKRVVERNRRHHVVTLLGLPPHLEVRPQRVEAINEGKRPNRCGFWGLGANCALLDLVVLLEEGNGEHVCLPLETAFLLVVSV